MHKIIVAKNAGFCMGVKRAVDMVLELAKKSSGPIYTYGPLIHNPQVIKLLAKKDIKVLDKNVIPKRGTIVIRTHGVKPEIRKNFEKRGLNVYDATCPFVKKVQHIINEYSDKGYTIVIVGDKGHAEVDSYLGYSHNKGIVVSSLDDVKNANISGKVCVVAQTTQDKKIFQKIVKKIETKCDAKVFDTICNATSKRQEETMDISRVADAMIVVGGSNSANTKRLVDICKSSGTPTYFIETAKELELGKLAKYNVIGITAGASTSKETIQEVVKLINKGKSHNGACTAAA